VVVDINDGDIVALQVPLFVKAGCARPSGRRPHMSQRCKGHPSSRLDAAALPGHNTDVAVPEGALLHRGSSTIPTAPASAEAAGTGNATLRRGHSPATLDVVDGARPRTHCSPLGA
jgi:hypothetical protein